MKRQFILCACFDLVIIIFLAVICASCKQKPNNTPAPVVTIKCPTCLNGGVCINDTCSCPAGYSGTYCEIVSRQKFMGNWTVFEKGSTSTAAQYEVSILAASNVSEIDIINFNNFFLAPIIAEVNGDTIVIPNQEHNGKVVFGKGYIYPSAVYGQYGAMSVSYEIVDTATNAVNDYGLYSADHSNPSSWNKWGCYREF